MLPSRMMTLVLTEAFGSSPVQRGWHGPEFQAKPGKDIQGSTRGRVGPIAILGAKWARLELDFKGPLLLAGDLPRG